MQTKEIDFFHLKELVEQVNIYQRMIGVKKNSLSVRIDKVLISIKSAVSKYNSKLEDIRTDHCSLDGDGNMLIKEGQKGEDRFSFKPDQLKKMRAEMEKLDDEKVQIDVNITGNVPSNITYAQAKYFRGILIPENYVYKDPFDELAEMEANKE